MSKENRNTKTCKYCQSDIPFKAKICPNCKKKQGGGFRKILIFPILLVLLALAVSSGDSEESGNDGSENIQVSKESGKSAKGEKKEKNEEEKKEYISVTADKLHEELKDNAMRAQEKYKDKYLKIKGKLGNIDSDGKYINIDTEEITFTNIQCYIKNDEQKDAVMEMSNGDEITVKGKCKEVGEIIGYSIDIESIK